jgi:hypothetical protein
MNKLVDEAPYHPGYEDAVVNPAQKYKGVDPAKMIWKQKPLSDEEIQVLINDVPDYDIGIYELFQFARAIEERHGIK